MKTLNGRKSITVTGSVCCWVSITFTSEGHGVLAFHVAGGRQSGTMGDIRVDASGLQPPLCHLLGYKLRKSLKLSEFQHPQF